MPAAYLPMQPGGGRRDDDEVGVLAEAGVRDRVSGPSNSEVRAGSDASAENVSAPTKRVASSVSTGHDVHAGVDEPAADLDGLVRRDPAGDAEDDPPAARDVGRGSRRGSAGVVGRGVVAGRGGSTSAATSASSSSTGSIRSMILPTSISSSAIDSGLRDTDVTCGRHDPAEALAELVVVVVDLPGPHRGQRHQRELGVDLLHEVLDAGLHQRRAAFGHVMGLPVLRRRTRP